MKTTIYLLAAVGLLPVAWSLACLGRHATPPAIGCYTALPSATSVYPYYMRGRRCGGKHYNTTLLTCVSVLEVKYLARDESLV